MRRRGFTLIELLVVIAIIGILAAMLFPVFARARESARKTQCLANVKNIAIALNMYLADWDKGFPRETNAGVQATAPPSPTRICGRPCCLTTMPRAGRSTAAPAPR
jgi:prepilin-type N-terminal cleavage/methylation domain-containing protein